MLKIFWTSDIHLGLVTNEVDRTREIMALLTQLAKDAIKARKQGHDVKVVVGGDIYNKNTPSEAHITCFIKFLNWFIGHNIEVFVLSGNHDAINDPSRYTCLDFISKLETGGYPFVKLITDICTMPLTITDSGPVVGLFLPHITKANLVDTEIESTQEYINTMTEKVMRKVGPHAHFIGFSHLNIRGVMGGSEENLLKKSEAYLPDWLVTTDQNVLQNFVTPTIVQGHIHRQDTFKNVEIIGAPLRTDSSDKDKVKYFAVVNVPMGMQEEITIDRIPTNCGHFIDIELDLLDQPISDLFEHKAVRRALKKEFNKFSVVKVSPIINEEWTVFDWEKFRSELAQKLLDLSEKGAPYVKPIVPKIIKNRVVRNEAQLPSLQPVEAVKVWLKGNNTARAKERYRIAKEIIAETTL